MAADNEIVILVDDQKEKKDQNDQNTQNEFGQDEFVLLEGAGGLMVPNDF